MRAAAAFSFLLPRAANGARIVAHSKSHRGQVPPLVWNAAWNGTTSRMSTTSIATLNRITAKKLADLLLADAQQEIEAQGSEGKESKIAIVDVRDDDHIGGHIRSSLHYPSRSLDATMPTLLRKLADKETVVFHCALSQQRGPSAALRYLREREAQQQQQQRDSGDDALSVDKQKVYVLDRGFVGWQEVYGPDERLTEAWRKELWEEDY